MPGEMQATAAASELIGNLPAEHKYALGGLCAALLGRAHRERLWSEPWCHQHLLRLAQRFLVLAPEQCEGLVPLLEASAHVEPAAFVSLLPPDEHDRAALLLGILVLTVASEDAQLVGYDARARQLLVDVADVLGVPWPRVAAMERELAISMRSQANARAQPADTAATSGRHQISDSTPQQQVASQAAAPSRGSSSSLRLPFPSRRQQSRASDSGGSAAAAPAAAAPAAAAPGNDGGGGSTPRMPALSARWRKRLAVGAIGVASGVAIGLTAGLATPMVVTGLAAVGSGISGLGGVAAGVGATVSATAAMLSGAVGVTVVTTVFGATGAGLASYKMDRRLGDVKEFEFIQPPPRDDATEAGGDGEGGDGGSGAGEAEAGDGAQADGLAVCVCVSGWLVDDDDSPTNHWWGGGPDKDHSSPTMMSPSPPAARPPASATPPPTSRAYYWPKPASPAAVPPAAPPAAAPPMVAASASDAVLNAATGSAGLEHARWERAAWLVEMGFPPAESKRAARKFLSTEVMVEHLLSIGVMPSLDAAAATAGAPEATDVTDATDPSSLEVPWASLRLAGDDRSPVVAAVVDAAAEGPPAPTTPMPAAEGPQAPTTPPPGSGSSPMLSTTAVLASFVQVDAPKRSALECVPFAEHHVLLWESKELRVLGNALGRIAASEALAVVASQTLKQTFLATLMSALAPPAYLIKACDVLDNPWAVAFCRAQKAGVLLAEVLLERAHGARPVILIGFGLGARLLYEAALHLAEALASGDGRAAGVIQHLVLMGLPATCEPARWRQIRLVTAGRIVNCYRPNDLVLAIAHRAANFAFGVAGLAEVKCAGVENFDVSGVVAAHHKYRHATSDVLSLIGLEDTV